MSSCVGFLQNFCSPRRLCTAASMIHLATPSCPVLPSSTDRREGFLYFCSGGTNSRKPKRWERFFSEKLSFEISSNIFGFLGRIGPSVCLDFGCPRYASPRVGIADCTPRRQQWCEREIETFLFASRDKINHPLTNHETIEIYPSQAEEGE